MSSEAGTFLASALAPVGLVALLLGTCAGGPAVMDASGGGTSGAEENVLMGRLSRAEIEAALPDWVGSAVEAEPDLEAATALADLVTTARVTVFFGSWCSDSRRELSRLWAALDLGGGDVGFPIDYIAVDRSKSKPAELVAGRGILYVPTLIVEDNGREVGRIIEKAPEAVESDLLALLAGESRGWISARTDLPSAANGDSR